MAPAEISGDSAVRGALVDLAARYGPALLRDPQRCEAMLRDICPGRKREIFLIVSALREHVAADLLTASETVPQDVVLAHGTRKLRDNLGLSEESARWAVESWVPASVAISEWREPPRPAPLEIAPEPVTAGAVPMRGFDTEWLASCGAVIVLALLACGIVWRVAFWHGWVALSEWGVDAAMLIAGCGVAAGGLITVERRLRAIRVPRHGRLRPGSHAFALTAEVVTLLVLPVVPPVTLAVWAFEWTSHTHDLVFHLGRMLQTLLLFTFLFFWVRTAVRVEGVIASSVVRQR
jgi:hypothetical protein